MKYTTETTLLNFPAWAGAKRTLEVLSYEQARQVEALIEELYFEDVPTDTQINDFLWFEKDYIAEYLGFEDWEELEKEAE